MSPSPDASATTDAQSDHLSRYRDGEHAAFEALVDDYEKRLIQFFYRLCWDRGRAEDMTQNLFLKLLRSAGRYQPEGKLTTFIFRVATNLWIDHYRSERPRRRLFAVDQAMLGHEAPLHGNVTPSPSARIELDEEKQRMRDALEGLTEPHRLVFELAVYQELPYAEISRVLEIPVGTVKSRMHNSVKALRDRLHEDASDESGGVEAGASRRFPAAGGSA